MGDEKDQLGQVAQLLQQHVGLGGMTLRELELQAVDQRTGYRPSRSTLWKLHRGERVRVNPELVRAVAVGLAVPLHIAESAFAVDYITGECGQFPLIYRR